jgi:predicted transcriptional regulator
MGVQEMVKILLEEGYRQVDLAIEVNTTQATVNRIFHGSMPSYELGKRIENLYLKDHKRQSLG